MTFKAEHVERFRQLFESRKQQIRHFAGCAHLELWQEKEAENIFFTYSVWSDAEALLHYRNSTFFRDTWKLTKELFEQKAEAWSIHQCDVVE